MYASLCIFLLTLFSSAAAQAEYARVEEIKGTATITIAETTRALKLRDDVPLGAVIITAARSLVRLNISDGSSLLIAPNSRFEIEPISPGGPDVWNLAFGRIRALIIKEHKTGKEKLIVKTPTAALGIRGTEFVLDNNKASNNVSLVTIEGSVGMAKLEPGQSAQEALRGPGTVTVSTGSFSVVSQRGERPSVPQTMPPQQMRQLERNSGTFPSFDRSGAPKGIDSARLVNPGQGQNTNPEKFQGGPGEGNRAGPQGKTGPDSFPGIAGPPRGGAGVSPEAGGAAAPEGRRDQKTGALPGSENIPSASGAPAGVGGGGAPGSIVPSPNNKPGMNVGPQAPGQLPQLPGKDGKQQLPPPPPPPPPPPGP